MTQDALRARLWAPERRAMTLLARLWALERRAW
jgi:hypothetical protein